MDYPEIDTLNELWTKHKVETKIDRSQLLEGRPYYPLVRFKIGGEDFELFVDDEYDDLKKNYPLLNFCLVLRELEGFQDTKDFEYWCQERSLDSTDPQVFYAFNHLEETYEKVVKIMGSIDSHVSDWDFEMNTGAAQELRRN